MKVGDIDGQYHMPAGGLGNMVHERQGAPAAGWRRLQAMQTMDVTACGSSRWSSASSWQKRHACTCPQHGATTLHLSRHIPLVSDVDAPAMTTLQSTKQKHPRQ